MTFGRDHMPLGETGPFPVTMSALFIGFFRIAVVGFGGTLPWARRLLVEQRRWLTEHEFVEVLGICHLLPGPNVINISIYVGARFHGVKGAIAAFSGLTIAPVVLVLLLAALYDRYGHVQALRGLFGALSPAVAGLVIATGLKMAFHYRHSPPAMLFGLLAFAGVGLLRFSVVSVLFTVGALSIATAWARR